MGNQIKARPNKIGVTKEIRNGAIKKYSYLIEKLNSIEFSLPEKNNLTYFLFRNIPLVKVDEKGKFSVNGKLGSPTIFYIPIKEYKKLLNLFEEFNMPANLHVPLTVAFLNMVFAACDSTYTTKFYEDHNLLMKEIVTIFELLEQFSTDKLLIENITLDIKEQLPTHTPVNPAYGNSKTIKLKGHVATQLVEKILANYKNIEGYKVYLAMYESEKNEDKLVPFTGHRNAEKQFQSYYSWAIIEYLDKTLFSSAFSFFQDPPIFQKEIAILKKKYSKRRLLLFIGNLMINSNLLKLKEGFSEEEIIDNMKKKLTPHFKAKRQRLAEIKQNNEASKTGMIEVIPADLLF